MNRAALALVSAIFAPLLCQAASPFAGRWDFTVPGTNSNSSYWLGVTEKNGALEVSASGGNVVQEKDFKAGGFAPSA